MVDQAAKDIYQAGMGISGLMQNMDRLAISKKRDIREQTVFDQSQKEREAQIMARQEVANAYQKSGVIDENGNITNQGYQAFLNPDMSDKNAAVNALNEKGKNAYAYMKAQTEFTGQLLKNEQNKQNLHMLAFKRADETYNTVITPSLKAAEISVNRGDRKGAAQNIANAIMGANHRVRAKAVGDKIETWQVVNGERQPSQTMSIEDAMTMAKDYTRENYVPQAAAEIVAGYKSNSQPKTFNLKSPKGKDYRAVQVFKSDSTVDYLFFNKDGSVAKDAPHDLEQAYQKGWTQVTAEGQKAALDARKTQEEIRYKQAQTTKVKKETEQIGKESKPSEDLQKYGEKRFKALSDSMADYDELHMDASPEDRQVAKEKFLVDYNKTVHGWEPYGKVRGNMLWKTGKDNEIVDDYGRPVKIKERGKSVKTEKNIPEKQSKKKDQPKIEDEVQRLADEYSTTTPVDIAKSIYKTGSDLISWFKKKNIESEELRTAVLKELKRRGKIKK